MGTSRLKSRRRQEQGSKWTRVSIAILATIGVIDTGSITINRWGLFDSLSCPGGANGCEAVLNSPWGTVFQGVNYSIPLSFVGFLSYISVLALAIIPFFPIFKEIKNDLNRKSWWGLFFITTGMAVFSLLLITIMIFKIGTFCLFCFLSTVISISLLILTLIGGKWEDRGKLLFRGFILSLIILLGGLIWSSSVDPSQQKIEINQSGVPPTVLSESTESTIALAKHLTSIGATQYSAYWCPHCHEQKELFGKEAASILLAVECAKDGRNNQAKLCESKGITGFPSWEINGKIEPGVQSLNELANMSDYQGPRDF